MKKLNPLNKRRVYVTEDEAEGIADIMRREITFLESRLKEKKKELSLLERYHYIKMYENQIIDIYREYNKSSEEDVCEG